MVLELAVKKLEQIVIDCGWASEIRITSFSTLGNTHEIQYYS